MEKRILILVAIICIIIIFLIPFFYQKEKDGAGSRLLEIPEKSFKIRISAPSVTNFKKGETTYYQLRINNTYSNPKTFYIRIYLEGVGGELRDTPVSSLQTEVNNWLEYSKTMTIDAGKTDTDNIIIHIPANASTGIYMFRMAVCTDESDANICNPGNQTVEPSASLYGSSAFAIEITE